MSADVSEAVLASLTQTRSVRFWGREYTVTPLLVTRVLGDGGQVIAFQPLATRPDYYVVRVDSSWDLDNHHWEAPEPFIDHVDEVYEAIELEYGHADQCNEAICPADCNGEHPPEWEPEGWPVCNSEYGSGWWFLAGHEAGRKERAA